MKRRQLLQAGLAIGGAQALAMQSLWAAAASLPAKTQVIVIGGGYGGATAAKYVRMFSNYKINVVLIVSLFVSIHLQQLKQTLRTRRSVVRFTYNQHAPSSSCL